MLELQPVEQVNKVVSVYKFKGHLSTQVRLTASLN